MVNDIGAYFIGVLFGRNKVNPRISPKKTWEGFFGGIVISFLISMGFALLVGYLGYPILPFLTPERWYWIVLLSLAMPIIGNLGDFTFSSIKRHYEIKDFGMLLKGHGGILDRLIALLPRLHRQVSSLDYTAGILFMKRIFCSEPRGASPADSRCHPSTANILNWSFSSVKKSTPSRLSSASIRR